jgi:hypothetical protein
MSAFRALLFLRVMLDPGLTVGAISWRRFAPMSIKNAVYELFAPGGAESSSD